MKTKTAKTGPFVVGLPDTQGGMCWLAGLKQGDPERYYTPSCAIRFETWDDAEKGIEKAKETHPFKERAYRIIPVSEMGEWNKPKP